MQAELARDVGLDESRFLLDVRSGRAKEAFDKDLGICRKYGVTGFPTFLIRDREGSKTSSGYHHFEYFEKAFRDLSPNIREQKQEFNKTNVLRFHKETR